MRKNSDGINKGKTDFPINDKGKVILKTAEEIANWVKLGYEEQNIKYEENPTGLSLELTIDLSNCDLSSFCSINQNGDEFRIFNLCDLANIVEGIISVKGNADSDLFIINNHINLSGTILYSAFFDSVIFKKGAVFQSTIICGTASFLGCTFEKYANFNTTKFLATTTFEGCSFKSMVSFRNASFSSFSINFSNTIFYNTFNFDFIKFSSIPLTDNLKPLLFRKCVFIEDAEFKSTTFTLVTEFVECVFKGEIFFSNSAFEKLLLFQRCNIGGTLIFNSVDNETLFCIERMRFWSNIINGSIHIELRKIDLLEGFFSCIKNEGQMRFARSEIKQIDFCENTINGRMDILTCKIEKIDINATIVTGFLNVQDTDLDKNNINDRHTAQILKHEAIKLNNIIQAQQMKAIEMNLYLKELCKKSRKEKGVSCWKFVHQLPLGREMLLFFNRISNGYGYKWGRGILFTMISALSFYFLINYFGVKEQLFVLDFKFKGFGEVWKGYLNVLNVLNFRDKLEGFHLNAWGETFFFLSKIILSYGIYQTVSAFRKYGK